MAEPDKRPVTMEELLVSSLAQTDALAKLMIEKGLITRDEFMQKISEERATYQKLSILPRNDLSERYNQTQNNLTEATEALYSAFINRNLRIYNAPDLREHVLNAVSIETPRGIRLSKQKTSAKIDGAVALSFAVLAAVQYGRPASIADSPIGKMISRTGFDARRWIQTGGKAR
jgi:hypothetical protein